jgi:HEAT repeat protein
MGSNAAADSIARLLDAPEPWVRMAAAHALGEIGAAGASAHLASTLDDSIYSVVNAALVGLGRLRAVEAYEQILALTASDNKHVRKHAAIALGEIGDSRAITTVRQMAKHDADSGVRFMAAKALTKLENNQ